VLEAVVWPRRITVLLVGAFFVMLLVLIGLGW
jgi:hypothetical protein